MSIERNPVIDFRAMHTTAFDALEFTIQPDDSLADYIRKHQPNAVSQKQLDDNEHQILRWMGAE